MSYDCHDDDEVRATMPGSPATMASKRAAPGAKHLPCRRADAPHHPPTSRCPCVPCFPHSSWLCWKLRRRRWLQRQARPATCALTALTLQTNRTGRRPRAAHAVAASFKVSLRRRAAALYAALRLPLLRALPGPGEEVLLLLTRPASAQRGRLRTEHSGRAIWLWLGQRPAAASTARTRRPR